MSRQTRTVIGLVLCVIGLGVVGVIGWQYFGTGIASKRAMGDAEKQLRQEWSQSTPLPGRPKKAIPGDAIALLRIPRFGADWEKPIIHGIDDDELARGLGHYQRTQMPGEKGNFAVAGHRVTHDAPFGKLKDLEIGDQVIVETRDAVYTYEIDRRPRDLTVKPGDGWVLEPVPGRPDAIPKQALITLTTCQDLFQSPDRSVGFGHLVSTRSK